MIWTTWPACTARTSTEYKKLPGLYDALWAIFQNVRNTTDLEQFRQALIPDFVEDEQGESYDTKQKIREDFYAALREFGLCLEVALGSASFYQDSSFSETDIQAYKQDLRFSAFCAALPSRTPARSSITPAIPRG